MVKILLEALLSAHNDGLPVVEKLLDLVKDLNKAGVPMVERLASEAAAFLSSPNCNRDSIQGAKDLLDIVLEVTLGDDVVEAPKQTEEELTQGLV